MPYDLAGWQSSAAPPICSMLMKRFARHELHWQTNTAKNAWLMFSKFLTRLSFALWWLSVASANAFASDFDGVWELVSGEYVDGSGTLVDYQSMDMKSIKLLHDGHYQFISMSGDKFWASGAGSYHVDGAHYVETPRYVSYPMAQGTVYQFRFRLDGEHWHNERWQDGRRVEYEVWRRLKTPKPTPP